MFGTYLFCVLCYKYRSKPTSHNVDLPCISLKLFRNKNERKNPHEKGSVDDTLPKTFFYDTST